MFYTVMNITYRFECEGERLGKWAWGPFIAWLTAHPSLLVHPYHHTPSAHNSYDSFHRKIPGTKKTKPKAQTIRFTMVSSLSSRLLGLQANADGTMATQLPLARLKQLPPGSAATKATTTTTTKAAVQFMPAPPLHNANTQKSSTTKTTATTATEATLPAKTRYRPIRPRISGYSADQESAISSNQLASNNTANTIKDKRALEVVKQAKKRKLEEMNYAALTIKEALTKAGKSYSYALQGRARALPAGSVDTTKVRLVSAEQYDEEELQQHDEKKKNHKSKDKEDSIAKSFHMSNAIGSANMYDALMGGTRHFYTSPGSSSSSKKRNAFIAPRLAPNDPTSEALVSSLAAVDTTRRDFHSGTSTATPSTSSDTESDASLGAIEIPPRLEEGLSMSGDEGMGLAGALSPSPPAVDMDRAKRTTTSIENALSYSPQARLVVRSKEPFHIVHANAAYFHLTGLKESSIFGQSLSSILNDTTPLSPSTDPSDLLDVVISNPCVLYTDTVTNEGGVGDAATLPMPKMKCRMSIAPVSDSACTDILTEKDTSEAGPKVTHYLIELAAFDETNDTQIETDNLQKNTADSLDKGFSVIG